MDTETDFNNNRRNGVAYSDYGSEGSWNDCISLAKKRRMAGKAKEDKKRDEDE